MESLYLHCSAAFSQHGGLFAVFFMGGLTGGFTHCLSMCGSIVASETVACRSACAKGCGVKNKLSSSMGLPYHIGRATSYGALGFFSALLSKQVAATNVWPWLSAAMLTLAGVMFLASSLPGCKHLPFQPSGKLTYTRGILLGFMPCGLLYAALMMAATLADPLSGMIAMWLFVAGTIPALVLASAGAEIMTKKWQPMMQNIGRAMMAFNGLSLLVMAEKIVR